MLIIKLTINAAKCGNPGTEIDAGNITIIGYHEPAVEGSTVAFVCPPELHLSGSRTSVCTREGKWVPDPTKVACMYWYNIMHKLIYRAAMHACMVMFRLNIELAPEHKI